MDDLLQFRDTYFAECVELPRDLDSTLAALDDGSADTESLHSIFRAVHSIKAGLVHQVGEVESMIFETQVINGKTNLLALNARMRAACAGEEGKGFAVVSDEIRGPSRPVNALSEKIASTQSRSLGGGGRSTTDSGRWPRWISPTRS